LKNRFGQIDEQGRIVALVAEGLPAWPDDGNLSEFTDEQLAEVEAALLTESAEIMGAGDDADIDRAEQIVERVGALRTEAATRMAAADEPETSPELEELAALSDEDRAAVVQYAADVAAIPPPADEDAALARRRDALARLGDLTPPPAPELQGLSHEAAASYAEATAAGMARGFAPVVEALTTAATALATANTPPAPGTTITARELGRYRPSQFAPAAGTPEAPRPRGHLVHRGDVAGMAMGAEFTSMRQLVDAFVTRHRTIGQSAAEDEQVLIASYQQDDPPPERDLRHMSDSREVRQMIDRVVGPDAMGRDPWNLSREVPISRGGIAVTDSEALVASGGLAAPVEPYYPQLVLAVSDRPGLGSMPGFITERGGIRLVLPPNLNTLANAVAPGTFADGVAATSTAWTSATAEFTDADVGQPIIGTDIPAGTIINSVTNGTTLVLSAATTASATGLTFYLPSRNPTNLGGPVGKVTAAQDAAGPPNSVKFTYDVANGTQVEHDVYSVYTSLQFGNLTARTFPEQVEANIRLANALAARVAETAMLDYITGWSTLITAAKTFGTARQLLAQFEHMAAMYRNNNRMDPAAVLRLGIPAWALNAMRSDYISSFIGGAENWGLSDEELNSWFADRNILPFFYLDGPSDISQLFPVIGSGAINTGGTNTATPVALPDYPGQGATTSFRTKVVSFMWAEGTWLGLTTGELNIGLVRDSILNSSNRFRNFEEVWESPAFVGLQSLRCVHTVAADGTYGAAVSITLGVGSGL